MSVGKLCDDNGLTSRDKRKFMVHEEKPMLKATRCPISVMHVIDIANPLLWTPRKLININLQRCTSLERLYFLHGSLGFPTLSSQCRSISEGCLLLWPDLKEKNTSRIATPDIAVLGYMDQKRKNIQSTKVIKDIDEWTETLKYHTPNKIQDFFHTVLKQNNTMCTDQTVKIRVRSIRGCNYMLITYCYDSNAILVRLLRSRKGSELAETTETAQETHEYLAE